MSTKIYGCSDDNIDFEGDIYGEVSCYGTDDQKHGVLVLFSDGTVLEVKYGKNGDSIWEIKVKHKGKLFDRIELCDDSEADIYSDQVFFKDGLKWAYAAKDSWERVQ
jgi:hypothetical protein